MASQPEIDWEAIERSPEFQELVHKRRGFVIPCTIGFLAWYLGFILLCAYAPDFMGESVYQGLTVGYCLALTQFVMVFGLGLWYLRSPTTSSIRWPSARSPPTRTRTATPAASSVSRPPRPRTEPEVQR